MNNCTTCKWATWVMTNHRPPRIDKKKSGRCEYPMERVALPLSFRLSYSDVATPDRLNRSKSFLTREHPYENCRVWEKQS